MGASMEIDNDFYKNHRGGLGAVVTVTAINSETGSELLGVFSSVETAESWRGSLPDGYHCIFSPYIVDDPDWGNEANTRR